MSRKSFLLGSAGGDSQGEDEIRSCLNQTGYRFIASQWLQRRPEWTLFASPAAR